MATVHVAYPFNRSVVKSHFVNERDGVLTHQQLLDLARRTMENPTPAAKDFLENIRFDEEWFHTADQGTNYEEPFLKVIVAEGISGSVSLDRISFALAERLLPDIRWPAAKVSLLLLGRRFKDLISSLDRKVRLDYFDPYDLTLGWLGSGDLLVLKRSLIDSKEAFLNPSPSTLSLLKSDPNIAAMSQGRGLESLIAQAYDQFLERHWVPLQSDRDLLIYNDVSHY
jgi:hypothetical protein